MKSDPSVQPVGGWHCYVLHAVEAPLPMLGEKCRSRDPFTPHSTTARFGSPTKRADAWLQVVLASLKRIHNTNQIPQDIHWYRKLRGASPVCYWLFLHQPTWLPTFSVNAAQRKPAFRATSFRNVSRDLDKPLRKLWVGTGSLPPFTPRPPPCWILE
ncbi:hypothetical protein PM082_016077 [Marasmius tenuissimus]|nr:hypothetical protein PM082_016077 [Marasmius tenuissimus]